MDASSANAGTNSPTAAIKAGCSASDLARRSRVQSATLGPNSNIEPTTTASGAAAAPPSSAQSARPSASRRGWHCSVSSITVSPRTVSMPPRPGAAAPRQRRQRAGGVGTGLARHRERDRRVLDLMESRHRHRDLVPGPADPRLPGIVELGMIGMHVRRGIAPATSVRVRRRDSVANAAGSVPTIASGTPSTSASFSRITPSSEPKPSTCAKPTFVITAIVGSMMRRSCSISPRTLAPASTTRASLSSGAPRMVSGTPTRLLRLAVVACTRQRVATAARIISLVLVFPLDPVMATTGLPAGTAASAGPRQQAERLERVAHFEEREPGDGRRAPAHDCGGGALGARGREKLVRVEPLAFEGDKQGVRC